MATLSQPTPPEHPELFAQVLSRYESIEGVPVAPLLAGQTLPPGLVQPLGEGLINETYLVELPSAQSGSGGQPVRAVLQRVNPIFDRSVHKDIEAVTAHLQSQGLVTPRLHRAADGELSVDLGEGGVWRLMTFIPGHSYSRMTPALARPAGALVGRFHATLTRLQHRFNFVRPGAHNLFGFMQRLRTAIQSAESASFTPPESPVPADFLPLARELAHYGQNQQPGSGISGTVPLRMCHGDLKVSNLRFDDNGEGVCLLDLDTLGNLPLAFELGDALRSWCNPTGEDATDASFNLDIFEEALAGYAEPSRTFLTHVEREMLLGGIERITFQLAVRFAIDVVSQSYFRWDKSRFASRADHNLARAMGQWQLLRSIAANRTRAQAILRQVLR